jgi:hypothetical protein
LNIQYCGDQQIQSATIMFLKKQSWAAISALMGASLIALGGPVCRAMQSFQDLQGGKIQTIELSPLDQAHLILPTPIKAMPANIELDALDQDRLILSTPIKDMPAFKSLFDLENPHLFSATKRKAITAVQDLATELSVRHIAFCANPEGSQGAGASSQQLDAHKQKISTVREILASLYMEIEELKDPCDDKDGSIRHLIDKIDALLKDLL